MNDYEPFVSLAVALGLGLIIGLERERSAPSDQAEGHSGLGGARTYPLFALLGAVSMLVGRTVGVWIVGLVFVGLMSLALVAYADDVRSGRDRGITSEAAFVLTFLLGALALAEGLFPSRYERLVVVSAVGVTATALLSMKSPLHGFAKQLSRDDVYATLKFLVVAVIVLPLLPNRTVDPLDALNPFHVGLMVVLIAGLGFAGYVAVRVLGPGRGLGLTGLVGGFVSSTAVTLAMSGRARREPAVAEACALSILLACTIMPARIVGIAAVLAPGLALELLAPMGAMLAGGLAASAYFYLRSRKSTARAEVVAFTNPFELSSALKFGALFATVLFVAKAANLYLGHRGTYLAGVIAGATDVDAITLSMTQLAKDDVTRTVAATTVSLAAGSNTVVKALLALATGGVELGKRTGIGLVASLLGGALGLAWLLA